MMAFNTKHFDGVSSQNINVKSSVANEISRYKYLSEYSGLIRYMEYIVQLCIVYISLQSHFPFLTLQCD